MNNKLDKLLHEFDWKALENRHRMVAEDSLQRNCKLANLVGVTTEDDERKQEIKSPINLLFKRVDHRAAESLYINVVWTRLRAGAQLAGLAGPVEDGAHDAGELHYARHRLLCELGIVAHGSMQLEEKWNEIFVLKNDVPRLRRPQSNGRVCGVEINA